MRTKDFKRHMNRFDRCLTFSVRNKGENNEKTYHHFTDESMDKENKLHEYQEALSSFMYSLDCDNDSRYKYTSYAIQTIIDSYESLEDMEENDDPIYENASNDVDCYTGQLTEWLHASSNNVYYLSEALSEYGEIRDGFQALTLAQAKCIEEIYLGTKNVIVEFLKSKEQ